MKNRPVENKWKKKNQPINWPFVFYRAGEWDQVPTGMHCMEGFAFLSTVSKAFATAMATDIKSGNYSKLGISSENLEYG